MQQPEFVVLRPEVALLLADTILSQHIVHNNSNMVTNLNYISTYVLNECVNMCSGCGLRAQKPHRIVFSGYFCARKILFCAQINGKVLRFVFARPTVVVYGFWLCYLVFGSHIYAFVEFMKFMNRATKASYGSFQPYICNDNCFWLVKMRMCK